MLRQVGRSASTAACSASVVLLSLAATGCGGAQPSHAGAAPTALGTPLSSRPLECAAAQLRATAASSQGLTGGTRVLVIQFQNTSSTPCRLQGEPTVTMRSSTGELIPGRAAELDGSFGRQAPVTLSPGRGGAYLTVSLSYRTEAGDAPCREPQPAIARWDITLPGGRGTVVAHSQEALTTCHGRMQVGAITPGPAS